MTILDKEGASVYVFANAWVTCLSDSDFKISSNPTITWQLVAMTKIPQARIEPSISISSLLTLHPSYNQKNILLKEIKSNMFSDEYLS